MATELWQVRGKSRRRFCCRDPRRPSGTRSGPAPKGAGMSRLIRDAAARDAADEQNLISVTQTAADAAVLAYRT